MLSTRQNNVDLNSSVNSAHWPRVEYERPTHAAWTHRVHACAHVCVLLTDIVSNSKWTWLTWRL